jgi:predicted RNA methylase
MKEFLNKIFIWGTGFNAKRLNKLYQNELSKEMIIGYIDNNSEKWGTEFCGKKVYSPDSMKEMDDVTIYISINKYSEVLEQIRNTFDSSKVAILDRNYFKKKRLITRYSGSEEPEINEIIEYLDEHELDVFNYPWVEDYRGLTFDFYREDGLLYVIHKGKKLFFSKRYDTEEKAKEYYISLLLEQHHSSPHRYLTDSFDVMEGDVVVDAGAAEGIFSLDVIDKAKKIYMFEPESEWVEALEHTFSDYKEKVVIIQKCVSNYSDNTTTTIDIAVHEPVINFLKMDIEGEEFYALCGAKHLLERSDGVKCVVCTYHQEFAYYAIKSKLEEMGFNVNHSEGYMWYIEHFNSMRPMTLRRGVVRAEK